MISDQLNLDQELNRVRVVLNRKEYFFSRWTGFDSANFFRRTDELKQRYPGIPWG